MILTLVVALNCRGRELEGTCHLALKKVSAAQLPLIFAILIEISSLMTIYLSPLCIVAEVIFNLNNLV